MSDAAFHIGHRIKALREAKGMTRTALSKASSTSRGYIIAIETKERIDPRCQPIPMSG